MSKSYEEHVTALMESFAKYVDDHNSGTVDANGTCWARVPVKGPNNVFELARIKAAFNMALVEEPDDART